MQQIDSPHIVFLYLSSKLLNTYLSAKSQVKEYMSWRLKRNRKRLVRLDRAARRIQGALRAYLAQKRAQIMRESRACVYIQAVFRGWRGRLMFLEK